MKLELDDFRGRVSIDGLKNIAGLVVLSAKDKNSRRFGHAVHEANLDNGGDDTKTEQNTPVVRCVLHGRTDCDGDCLTEGNAEAVGTDTSTSNSSGCKLSDVEGADDSRPTYTYTEYETTGSELTVGETGCDDDCAGGEASEARR